MLSKKYVTSLLAAAGVLPFALALYAAINQLSLLGISADELISTYAVLIIAFMAGTHWGINLQTSARARIFLSSNHYYLSRLV